MLAAESGRLFAFADGVLGYLASGWRDERAKAVIASLLPTDRANWGIRDSLLTSTAWGTKEFAESSARALLAEPLSDWRYRAEDTHTLLEWGGDAISADVLQQWSLSDNATLSMTAISLMKDQHKASSLDLVALRTRFNHECQDATALPDGLDAVMRRNEAWCTGVYPALVSTSAS